MNAIIGHSGFVGSTLCRQARFESFYRSTNIGEIESGNFETVVCAGASAQKWLANLNPEADKKNIERLMGHLKSVKCKMFVLISTVDVFKQADGVDENTPVDEAGLHTYGLNRRLLERFVEDQFPDHLIVRLPGLVGPGLRKNAIFDLHNDNDVQKIDSRSVFQFYPMINLWYDIQAALQARLNLLHLTAEPLSIAEAARWGFSRDFVNELPAHPASYDFRTCHGKVFGQEGAYQYSARESIQAIRAYAQSEPRTLKTNQG